MLIPEKIPDESPVPTIESIQATIEEVESSQELEDSVRSKLLDLYRNTLSHTKQYYDYLKKTARYQELVTTGPSTIQEIHRQLQQDKQTSGYEENLAQLNLDELAALFSKKKSEVFSLKAAELEMDSSFAVREDRQVKLRGELDRAKRRLRDVQEELKGSIELGGNPKLQEARTQLLQVQKAARSKEISMLEQEAATLDIRFELLHAEHKRGQAELKREERYLEAIEDTISSRRQEEANRVKTASDIARASLEGDHPNLVDVADKNKKLSSRLSSITEQIEMETRAYKEAQDELERLHEEYLNDQKKLKKVGLSGVLGEIFLEQKRRLKDARSYLKKRLERRGQIGQLRIDQIRIEETLQLLADLNEAVNRTSANATPPIPKLDVERFSRSLYSLLQDQTELLRKVDLAITKYMNVLGDIDYIESQLSEQYIEYLAFLDEHLLWTPSTTVYGLATLKEIPSAFMWFVAPENWRSVLIAQRQGIAHRAGSYLVGIFLVLVLILVKRRFAVTLDAYAKQVRKYSTDNFLVTLRAFFLTIILAAPLPLFFALSGWVMVGWVGATPFAHGVGKGLLSVGGTLFVLKGFALLCARNGVAESHFRWSNQTLKVFRRHLGWFTWCGVGFLFVVGLTEYIPEKIYRDNSRTHSLYGRDASHIFILLESILFSWRGARALFSTTLERLVISVTAYLVQCSGCYSDAHRECSDHGLLLHCFTTR